MTGTHTHMYVTCLRNMLPETDRSGPQAKGWSQAELAKGAARIKLTSRA